MTSLVVDRPEQLALLAQELWTEGDSVHGQGQGGTCMFSRDRSRHRFFMALTSDIETIVSVVVSGMKASSVGGFKAVMEVSMSRVRVDCSCRHVSST